jgi:hypothetical protein
MLVQRQGTGGSGHWYEGHVHVVRQSEVGLVFHPSFGGWSASQRYTVRFQLNRIVMRRQHQALDSAFEKGSPFPFPRFPSSFPISWVYFHSFSFSIPYLSPVFVCHLCSSQAKALSVTKMPSKESCYSWRPRRVNVAAVDILKRPFISRSSSYLSFLAYLSLFPVHLFHVIYQLCSFVG